VNWEPLSIETTLNPFSGVTASVTPENGFKVVSIDSGSQFTGSLFVSGNIVIPSGSGFFSGSGRGLSDIPESALSFSPNRIASGSVTASVSPNFGFKVLSKESGSQFTGSVNISGSLFVSPFSGSIQLASGSSYYGEGQYLRNIPRSALTEDALISTEIKSGSITASVSPVFGFKVETQFTGSQFGSQFTGSVDVSVSVKAFTFIGDGSQLTNVQAQAASRIESGSVTASVSPNIGFRVESPNSGSEFTGSIDVSGSIFLNSGSFYSGSGRGLFDIPRSALTPDALLSTLITSGSVTASVTPQFGFKVESSLSGSQFTGSIFVSGSRGIELTSGSSYSGSGERLFNIPRSALTPDALLSTLIASGSVTASVTPEFGFKVISSQSGSQFTGSLFVSGARGI